MKKSEFLKMFFVGGAIGITLAIISYIVANVLMGNINEELVQLIKLFLFTYVCGGIYYTMASKSIKLLEHKDLRSIDRQKILKKQMKIILGVITVFVVILITYIFKKNTLGIILALSFIIVFVLWGYGCLLSYLNLKNNMAMINKKK